MLKVSEAASLALHATVVLAAYRQKVLTAGEMASALDVSENHLSKVLQRLVKAGLVKSTRGPKGGFALNRAPDEVTLLDVYEAIEGPLVPASCLFGRPACNGQCILGGLLESVNAEVRNYLAGAKLSSMSQLSGVCDA